ncbi:hypothetical protein [Glycomyces sp. NRRL B-16210]|uniref:hypothetical protein n=1 Tax=Glycomyces sp. NRRL B-16210 TaxID=1463821 RepID=UPI00068F5BE9|nr:hypothetical protein [Glycomyces sp. NRRL B-16210]
MSDNQQYTEPAAWPDLDEATGAEAADLALQDDVPSGTAPDDVASEGESSGEADDDPDYEDEDAASEDDQGDEDEGHAGRDSEDYDRNSHRHDRRHEREDWESGAAPDDSTVVEYQRRDAEALFLSGRPCSDANCQNRYNPAEDAWIKLVSAIPSVNQVSGLSVVTAGTAAPSQEDIQKLVNDVRPDQPNRYALRAISESWQAFKEGFDTDPGTGIAPWMKSALRNLSEHWKGTDFDAFAEQVEVVLANCAAVCDDIGDATSGAVGLLEQKADEMYALQGGASGELPYPAPLYWVSDATSMFTDPLVHVRPPFSNGNCQITAGCEHEGGLIGSLLELGGFNKDYVDEVEDYVEAQTQYYLAKGKNKEPETTEDQARRWARADADRNITADVNAGLEDYDNRSKIANEDVVNRWQNAEESAGSFTPEAKPSNPSNFRDASDILADSYGGLDLGSNGFEPGDAPPSGGTDLEPPDGGGSGGGTGGGLGGGGGGPAGGLASGGSLATLGGGGKFPVGAGSATGEGAASLGGGVGGGGGGRGMGGGMMGGMGGGGRGGMGGEQSGEGEHSDWLEEDPDIWGVVNIDEDPYA